jgi:hypothetical protein
MGKQRRRSQPASLTLPYEGEGTDVRVAIYRGVRKRRTPYTSAFVRGCKPATNMRSSALS